jgi:nicotinate-nucleotide pyrophosphorylase (carboxylating)
MRAFYLKTPYESIIIPFADSRRMLAVIGNSFCLFSSRVSFHAARMVLSAEEIRHAVQAALAEDIGGGDATTLATVPEAAVASALMRAREPLVVAGIAFAETAFRELSTAVKVERLARDGQRLKAGEGLLKVSGSARAILSAERVALNFVQRLCGVATLTAQFVDAIAGTHAKILDTRKTTPGWRRFEKYAVTCGGGKNHRIGLYDMVLIKDNHLAALRNESPNAIAAAVQRARVKFPQLKVEVEADTLEQVEQAAEASADMILLDNMTLIQLRLAVQKVKGRAQTEASGGVNLASVRTIAETGVDFISVGALTHSARAVDIGLDFEE